MHMDRRPAKRVGLGWDVLPQVLKAKEIIFLLPSYKISHTLPYICLNLICKFSLLYCIISYVIIFGEMIVKKKKFPIEPSARAWPK
jgi:hypothetical protein